MVAPFGMRTVCYGITIAAYQTWPEQSRLPFLPHEHDDSRCILMAWKWRLRIKQTVKDRREWQVEKHEEEKKSLRNLVLLSPSRSCFLLGGDLPWLPCTKRSGTISQLFADHDPQGPYPQGFFSSTCELTRHCGPSLDLPTHGLAHSPSSSHSGERERVRERVGGNDENDDDN